MITVENCPNWLKAIQTQHYQNTACEYFGEQYQVWVCASVMCGALQKQGLTQKKDFT
jgi:hypothetical protein